MTPAEGVPPSAAHFVDDNDGDDERAAGALLFSSTVTRGRHHQCGSGRRVKLYVLDNQAWVDRGTGYCAGVYDEERDEALIVARKEECCASLGAVADVAVPDDTPDGELPPHEYRVVVSESLDTDDVLLCAPVIKDDVYQRQQDTLVVWTDADGLDMALSFQELEGCNEVWDFITEVQQHYALSRGLPDGADGSLPPFSLPPPTLGNVEAAEEALRVAALHSVGMRDRIVEYLLQEDWLKALVPVLAEAEARLALPALHALCGIMKTVVTLNDNMLIEYLLHDDVFDAALGMLEYDAARPRLKASFRAYLRDEVRFHEVVAFDDPGMVTKILEAYRLVYLRDVVLSGLADDAVQSMLSSLVFFYHSDIVAYCAHSDDLWRQLSAMFAPAAAAGAEQRAKALLFLQQLCAMGKQVPMPSRLALFRRLVDGGVLGMLEYALQQPDDALRLCAVDILVGVLEYDAASVRQHMMDHERDGRAALLDPMLDVLTDDAATSVATPLVEALRVLLDAELEAAPRFFAWLYDGRVQRLWAPLQALPVLGADDRTPRRHAAGRCALYVRLCELLAQAVAQHGARIERHLQTSRLLEHVATLLQARSKTLPLAAVRVMRACLTHARGVLTTALVDGGVLGVLVGVLERELARDNLLSSALLGLFDQVRHDQVAPVLEALRTQHGAALQRLATHRAASATLPALLARDAPTPRAPTPDTTDAARDEDDYFDSEAPAEADVDAGAGAPPDEAAFPPLPLRRRRGAQHDDDDDDDDDDLLARAAKRRGPSPGTPRKGPAAPPRQAKSDTHHDVA